MKLLNVLKLLGLMVLSGISLAAVADSTTWKGVRVEYENASVNEVDGNLILTYTSTAVNGSLTLDRPVAADILVVGGGGGGGGGYSSGGSYYYGNGGDGGAVVERKDQLIGAGLLTTKVGNGGAGSNSSEASKFGGDGQPSSVSGVGLNQPITAAGGAGGQCRQTNSGKRPGTGASGSGSEGTESEITGSAYGAGGAAGDGAEATSATANTGNGGKGGRNTSNNTGRMGGNGGSGIVVVRLKKPYELLQSQELSLGETVDEFRDASDQSVSFAASAVTCRSSADLIASVVETADGRVGIVGRMAGRAQITIVAGDQVYVLDLTVKALLSGSYRAGAYEVAVTNASEVKYVDGDLVITYLDTNTAVVKSFALPKATRARLLAVGGGGAGGQDATYKTSFGLPGGGGAGGMVTNSQDFTAALYQVTVGAGGFAPRLLSAQSGADGQASVIRRNSAPMVTAQGGGGGGRQSAGKNGGCGGGGSYSSSSKNGGGTTQSPGIGTIGGKGKAAKYGGGGGGAGGGGSLCDTTASSSGAGGPGLVCDITGTEVEYARGGAGGAARLNSYYYYDGVYGDGVKHPTDKTSVTVAGKKVNVYLWEAEDGKPGRNGFGDGGGGSGHYGLSNDGAVTYAGSGGSGIVVVRIPPYSIFPEDALRRAFPVDSIALEKVAEKWVVTLQRDVEGPISLPDDLGAVEIALNGWSIIGAEGEPGDDITPGGAGQPALEIVPPEYSCSAGAIELTVAGTGSLRGGSGAQGYPGGAGAPAVRSGDTVVAVAPTVEMVAGAAGESLVQHPHQWAYTVEDGRIVATCVADDGVECSYRTRKPFVAVSAGDASYTSFRYDQLAAVNGITPVTGIVVSPETYVGRDGTDYPESPTPPSEQGAYTVKMSLEGLEISSDFYITEPKPSQDRVYQSWKSAERRGRDVRIYLSATFDGSKTINDGNILLLGSRCNAHSMATGTVEKSINALTKYANVRWYAYGSRDPKHNLVNQFTPKGEKLVFQESHGKVTGETVQLDGGNHFVYREMMDDLYAELVEKRNRDAGYDLLILEFDGDLLGRYGESPYQLVYSLPEGWTEEKAAQLRQAMSRYYAEDRVVWIVPDVNQEKSDFGYTGQYPWSSKPEFLWQRAFLNASETGGYVNPLQKNYENANELVEYLQEVLVGHFFSTAIIKDTLADGLSFKKITPQMRRENGVWDDFSGGPENFSIHEPRSNTEVTAAIVTEGATNVTATFDMRAEQAWALANNVVLGDDFRLVIDAELNGFFSSDIGAGEEQETNQGPATFIFTESNLQGEENYAITNSCTSPTIRNVKLMPVYSSEDVVKFYDGKGTNIVVKTVDPKPEEAVVRYSLDKEGPYLPTLSLTEVCHQTPVWFEITDMAGNFNTVTNFATVTIQPASLAEQTGVVSEPYAGVYDGEGHTIAVEPDGGAVEYLVDGEWVAEAPLYTNRVEATGVVFRVTRDGYSDFVGTNTVTVAARAATLVSGSKTNFVYDGAPHAFTNLAVTGFVAGEGLATTSDWATVTAVAEGEVANAFVYTLLPNTLADNYSVTVVTGTVAVVPAPLADPQHPGAPAPGTGLDFGPEWPGGVQYNGSAWEPAVGCTNSFETLTPGEDFDCSYFDNVNATNLAGIVIAGKGNYAGVITNYFEIWPREVVLKSGTRTMYLDPASPGTAVSCSNGFVWVEVGSFVTNSLTRERDWFEAVVTNCLVSAEPAGPIANEFTAKVSPGLESNYQLTLISGVLEILGSPTNSPAEEIHHEVPAKDGEGKVDVVMDNSEAGRFATDKPPELDSLGELVEKEQLEDVEIRLAVSENCPEDDFAAVTNTIVQEAISRGKPPAEVQRYVYDSFDLTLTETRWSYDEVDPLIPTNTVIRDLSNELDEDQLLTVRIPFVPNPKTVEFTIWRNVGGAGDGGSPAAPLPRSDEVVGNVESWNTNATEVILRIHRFTICVLQTEVLAPPVLTGRMRWKFHATQNMYYGRLEVTCVDGDNTKLRDVCYLYEDRDQYYLRNPTARSAEKLSATSAWTNALGQAFARLPLDSVTAELKSAIALPALATLGVNTETFSNGRYVVSSAAERTIPLAAFDRTMLADKTGSVLGETLGYLLWFEEGNPEPMTCPVTDLASVGTALTALSPQPLALTSANRALALGVPVTTHDSAPELGIGAFEVGERVIRGRVYTKAEGHSGIPGANARVTLLGAAVPGGPYRELAVPVLDAQGGFECVKPAEERFFRVRLEVMDIIR